MALEPAGLRWVNENLPSFIDGVRKANRAMGDAGDASQRTSSGFSALSGVIMGVASAGTTFALDAAVKMGSALVNLGASSIGVATEFQSMTARMEIAAGAAAEDAAAFGGLSEVALQVGGDARLLGVSATDAADAMTGLMKSGLSLEAIMGDLGGYMEGTAELSGALRASIDLAAATTLDMVQASDVAAITLATFGGEMETEADKAQFITDAMNTLVKAADASVAEVEDLAEALAYVGPTAAQAGLSFEDTNTALAVLSTAGIQGSRAGTTLESMLRSLQDPSKKAKTALDGLGISMYDAEGVMLPLVDIIAQFEVALGTATDAERDAALGAIFTAQGQRSMNVFLGKGVEGWLGMAEAMKGATGIQEQAERRANTFAGRMEALQGNVETLKIRIGTALLPVLTDLIGVFSELVDRYGPLLTSAFEKIGETLSNVVQVAMPFLEEFMTALEGGWPAVSALLMEWAGEFWNWLTGPGGVISTASSMIQRTISTIAEWLVANWPTIQAKLLEWATKFWDWMYGPDGVTSTARGTILQAVGVIAERLAENWPAIQAKLLEWAAAFWDWITEEVIPSAKKEFKKIGTAIRDWAESSEGQGVLEKVGESLGKALMAGIGIALKSTVELGTIFADTAPDIADAALTGWLPAIDAIVEGLVGGLIEGITSSLGIDLPPKLTETLTEAASRIIFPWSMLFEAKEAGEEAAMGVRGVLEPAFQSIASFIDETLAPAFQTVVDFLSVRITAAVETARATWDSLLETLGVVWSWIQENIIPVFEAIDHVISAVVNLALTAAAGFWENVLLPAIEKVWSFISENILPIFQSVKEGAEETAGEGVSFLTELWEKLREKLETVWSFIQENIIPIFEEVDSAVRETIGSALTWLKDTIITPLAEALQSIEGTLGTVTTNLETLASSIGAITLPAWLTPGSMTPFEEGLRGIGMAVTEEVAPAFSAFLTMLMTRWSAFGLFLTAESWPLLHTEWTLLTIDMETMWRQAMDLMEKRFQEFLSIVLAGIQKMIEAWTKLKTAIMAVAAAVVALHMSITKLTSDVTIKGLDRVASAFDDIKNSAEAAAKACEDAASACSGVGGGGAGPTSMQAGGMFQVPSAVGPSGMLIRVHPRELVRVIPAAQVAAGVGMGGGEVSVTVGPNYIGEEFDFAIFEDRVVRVVTDAIEA